MGVLMREREREEGEAPGASGRASNTGEKFPSAPSAVLIDALVVRLMHPYSRVFRNRIRLLPESALPFAIPKRVTAVCYRTHN
jgi:hypothetical protein